MPVDVLLASETLAVKLLYAWQIGIASVRRVPYAFSAEIYESGPAAVHCRKEGRRRPIGGRAHGTWLWALSWAFASVACRSTWSSHYRYTEAPALVHAALLRPGQCTRIFPPHCHVHAGFFPARVKCACVPYAGAAAQLCAGVACERSCARGSQACIREARAKWRLERPPAY